MHNFNPSYVGLRNDILYLIPEEVHKVLDIGCSIGTLGKQLKQRNNIEVIGIEIDKEMASIAENSLDKVILADVEDLNFSDLFPSRYFDCIVFADILEHLREPWKVVRNITGILSEKGLVIASIPNVRHYKTIIDLIFRGSWPYRERGIHDKGHLRFFAVRNIREMFDNSFLRINKIERKYRIIEEPHAYNKFSRFFALPVIREFLTFQYVILARKI